MKRALLLALATLTACASYDKRIAAHRVDYDADTALQTRMLEPLAIEPEHGQVTIAVTRKFAEKILLASLKPNLLQIKVAEQGHAWRSEGKKLGIAYVNSVALNQGALEVSLAASELALEDDTVKLRTVVDGRGALNADLHFFGATLNRDVELVVHHDQPLVLKLEAVESGWQLRAVGEPLRAEVKLQLPAVKLAGQDLYDLKIARTLELPLELLRPWPVPLPAPREVDVGPEKVRIGLQHAKFGAHQGVLWLGADLEVQGAQPPPAQPK